MKKRTIALIVGLFVIGIFGIVYILGELFTESEANPEITDAIKFKQEFESLNSSSLYREVLIKNDNNVVYSSCKNIIKRINEGETFAVLFGSSKDNWTRSIIELLLDEVEDKNIDTILYVSLDKVVNIYTLEDNTVIKKEQSKYYNELLDIFDNYLSSHDDLVYIKDGKEKKYKVEDKEIKSPTLAVVKNGNVVNVINVISKYQSDSTDSITDQIKCDIREQMSCLLDEIKKENYFCETEKKC